MPSIDRRKTRLDLEVRNRLFVVLDGGMVAIVENLYGRERLFLPKGRKSEFGAGCARFQCKEERVQKDEGTVHILLSIDAVGCGCGHDEAGR